MVICGNYIELNYIGDWYDSTVSECVYSTVYK